jgi:hypothetical protein
MFSIGCVLSLYMLAMQAPSHSGPTSVEGEARMIQFLLYSRTYTQSIHTRTPSIHLSPPHSTFPTPFQHPTIYSTTPGGLSTNPTAFIAGSFRFSPHCFFQSLGVKLSAASLKAFNVQKDVSPSRCLPGCLQ